MFAVDHFKWSPQQDAALRQIRRWLRDPYRAPIFRLFGYAGTGKTMIGGETGRSHPGSVFCALTGKAACVLRQVAGGQPTSTIHRLIYFPIEDEDDTYHYELRPREHLADISLLIVDECSMVDNRLARDLLSFGIPLLVIGDPFQLPPVHGASYFMPPGQRPDAMLTEVHRQAANNPILRLANAIRRGERLPRAGYRCGDALRIVNNTDRIAESDVTIVGINETRRRLNRRLRQAFGHARLTERDKPPQPRETVVCLRNDYGVSDPIFNGQLWQVRASQLDRVDDVDAVRLKLVSPDDGGDTRVLVPLEMFTRGAPPVQRFQEFDFGYALTVHKAQASEWDAVTLVDEAEVFRDMARRWLYTGITRARSKLTIVDWT